MASHDPTLPVPPGSERLLARSGRVMALFDERVRARVPAAATIAGPILVDTLPPFIEHVAEALDTGHPRRLGTEGTDGASEHGSERVLLTGYRPDDLVREYQILRDVIVEVLEETGPLTAEERRIVVASIDEAVVQACTAYFLTEERLREHFTVTLTHDLRGPLTAAKANASLILRRPASRDVPRWAARILDAMDRADRMVHDLLDASRLRAGARLSVHPEAAELVGLVRRVIENLETTQGDRFRLVAPERVEGWWSADELQRAIENLVSNALKYGDPAKPVTITVRPLGTRVRIEVHNEGSYIPTEERESLFRAYQRTRAAERSGKRGWGIGLALVRGVAEAHGGGIEIDSTPALGTTFSINLPVDARPFETAPEV